VVPASSHHQTHLLALTKNPLARGTPSHNERIAARHDLGPRIVHRLHACPRHQRIALLQSSTACTLLPFSLPDRTCPRCVAVSTLQGLSTSLSMQAISSPRTASSASPRRSQSTSPSITHKIAAYNAHSGPLDVASAEPARGNHSGPGGAATHPPSPPKPSYQHGTSRDFASPPLVAHGIGARVDIMPANRLAAEDLVERWNEWMKSGSVIASTATANGRGTASMSGHETPRSPTSSVTSFADQPPTVTASPIHSHRSPQASPRAVGQGLAGGHDRVNRTWDAGGAGGGGGAAASPPWMSVPSGRSIPQADPGTPSGSGKQVLLPLLQHEQAARRDAESEVCKLQGQLNKVMDERLRGDNEALWKHKVANLSLSLCLSLHLPPSLPISLSLYSLSCLHHPCF
jgi:hypothetical protein